MNILQLLTTIISIILIAGRYALQFFFHDTYPMVFDYDWTDFKSDYNKSYGNPLEESRRYKIFLDSKQRAEEHNQKYKAGLVTWTIGIDQFSDLTDEEYLQAVADDKLQEKVEARSRHKVHQLSGRAPASIDWRDFHAVSLVRRQNCRTKCGCCWAMAAVGAIESQYAILHGRRVLLSPQELIDCSVNYKNRGCSGGSAKEAFKYIIHHGLGSEQYYPYYGINGTCNRYKSIVKLIDFIIVPNDEQHLIDAVGTVGPVVVSLDFKYMKGYTSGIFKCPENVSLNNHELLMVGYGVENGVSYWLLKNSWGERWGERGYLRIRRSDNSTQCGIVLNNSHPSYPVIE